MAELRLAATSELLPGELEELHRLLDEAFEGDFADTDWTNSLGGTHVLLEADGVVVSHASIVARKLVVGDRALRTGYVEAVATRRGSQRKGQATIVLREVGRVVADRYEIGALSTGVPSLYERQGWRLWRGPTYAEGPTGRARTPDDDGGIMVLATPATGPLDLDGPITCDWRPGDVW